MAFEDSLNHRCNIYRLVKKSEKQNYSLPDMDTFKYNDIPSETDIPCHFCYGSAFGSLKQQEPQNINDEQIKLVFGMCEEIQKNDKIEDCQTGLFYIAGIPVSVRNHHKFVILTRPSVGKAI